MSHVTIINSEDNDAKRVPLRFAMRNSSSVEDINLAKISITEWLHLLLLWETSELMKPNHDWLLLRIKVNFSSQCELSTLLNRNLNVNESLVRLNRKTICVTLRRVNDIQLMFFHEINERRIKAEQFKVFVNNVTIRICGFNLLYFVNDIVLLKVLTIHLHAKKHLICSLFSTPDEVTSYRLNNHIQYKQISND